MAWQHKPHFKLRAMSRTTYEMMCTIKHWTTIVKKSGKNISRVCLMFSFSRKELWEVPFFIIFGPMCAYSFSKIHGRFQAIIIHLVTFTTSKPSPSESWSLPVISLFEKLAPKPIDYKWPACFLFLKYFRCLGYSNPPLQTEMIHFSPIDKNVASSWSKCLLFVLNFWGELAAEILWNLDATMLVLLFSEYMRACSSPGSKRPGSKRPGSKRLGEQMSRGANVSGSKRRGANVPGANVPGANVRGASRKHHLEGDEKKSGNVCKS